MNCMSEHITLVWQIFNSKSVRLEDFFLSCLISDDAHQMLAVPYERRRVAIETNVQTFRHQTQELNKLKHRVTRFNDGKYFRRKNLNLIVSSPG